MLPIVADPFYYAGDQTSVRVFICEAFQLGYHFQMKAAMTALDQLDVDKDGKVSYPEFLLALKFNVL